MILESEVLDVKPGLEKEFETAFEKAQVIISSTEGHISHKLHHFYDPFPEVEHYEGVFNYPM